VHKRDGINFEEAETHSLDDIDAHGTGNRSEGIE